MSIELKKFLNLKGFPNIGKTIFKYYSNKTAQNNNLVTYNIFLDQTRTKLQNLIKNKLQTFSFESQKESKAIACFVGSAIGDALGCHIESRPFSKDNILIQDFKDIEKYYNYM